MAYMNTLNIINDKGEIRLSLSRQSQLQKKSAACVQACAERRSEKERDVYMQCFKGVFIL